MGQTVDLGYVVGPTGATGPQGPRGAAGSARSQGSNWCNGCKRSNRPYKLKRSQPDQLTCLSCATLEPLASTEVVNFMKHGPYDTVLTQTMSYLAQLEEVSKTANASASDATSTKETATQVSRYTSTSRFIRQKQRRPSVD